MSVWRMSISWTLTVHLPDQGTKLVVCGTASARYKWPDGKGVG